MAVRAQDYASITVVEKVSESIIQRTDRGRLQPLRMHGLSPVERIFQGKSVDRLIWIAAVILKIKWVSACKI